MAQARMHVQAPIERLFAERWSTRAFDADTPVSSEHLASLLEAARWSPSCFGEQPWRFVVADRFVDEDAWQQMLATLAEKNRLWARNAPVLIACAALPTFARNGSANRWSAHDLGLATMALLLQATALGLAAHPMGGFDPELLRKRFGIPDAADVLSVIAIGHPADPEAAPSEFRDMETAPRSREPIENIAFSGRWDASWRPPAELGWEARYQETEIERLPWFHEGLDADIAAALDELGLDGGRVLDLGCGPGTQAAALAERGFEVTAVDVSWTAVEATRRRAQQAGVAVDVRVDNVLDSSLTGPFDLIIDRGVFHCFAEAGDQARYLATLRRLLAPTGILLLKCFHREETREEGPPGRYDASDIRRLFGEAFELIEAHPSHFAATDDRMPPRALFCILKHKEDTA